MNDRKKLLEAVQKYDFALKELNLFLDSHPNNRRALAKYHNILKMKAAAEQEFVQKYSAIETEQAVTPNRWTWIDGDWPWERS